MCHPSHREMWLSTRRTRPVGDAPRLREVRSMDPRVNALVAGDYMTRSLNEAWDLLDTPGFLPPAAPADKYQLLYMDAQAVGQLLEHPRLRLLGFDLSDEHTDRSLLHEPDRWIGKLEAVVGRVGEFGLLSWADAKLAQTLFQELWPDVPHFTVWALFEVVPSAEVIAPER